MAKQSRRKKNGVIGTLLVELSALAGIFGIAQPTVRNNLWQMIQPPTINSQLEQPPQLTGSTQFSGAQPQQDQFVPPPDQYMPSYVPEAYQPTTPSAYTAQAVLPRDVRNRAWNASVYNPMGSYQ